MGIIISDKENKQNKNGTKSCLGKKKRMERVKGPFEYTLQLQYKIDCPVSSNIYYL